MKRFSNHRRAILLSALQVLALSAIGAGGVIAATPPIDESQLLSLGFKVLVPTTTAQQGWVKSMVPGKMRPMQRNGKKFFIYPAATKAQIYVGGPKEYAAFLQLHPESQPGKQDAANATRAYRIKQDEVMRQATARDLSDPFLGVSWFDLGW